MESAIVAFRIDKKLLGKFDELCQDQGIYIRSEGLRKAVIAALKRGGFNND